MQIDTTYTTDVLLKLLQTPSPTGFTDRAADLLQAELKVLGIESHLSPKGSVIWEMGPKDAAEHITFSAHLDTLGSMVKAIKGSGRLQLWRLGGYDWSTIEGEDVTVHTQSGAEISGTVVNTVQSGHVHGQQLANLSRSVSTMEVRLDALTNSAAETRALGVEVGDFISFETHARVLPSGHIRSRHLDNKAAVAVFLAVCRELKNADLQRRICFVASTYEEVGHGAAAGIPAHTNALVAVDMAAVGGEQNSSEAHCTLCVADGSGPYDHRLGNRIRQLAAGAGVELKVDIYPFYSSDGTAALHSGLNAPVALIGPGVDASHAYERTHVKALEDTGRIVLELAKHGLG